MRFSGSFVAFTMAIIGATALGSQAAFAAAQNPFEQTVTPLQVGDSMSSQEYLDQDGRRFAFASLRGRTTLLGFIYTRCTDACPLITQKFQQLRTSLGPGRYHLVEASIDPAHDRVPALHAYARRYGAHRADWTFITGTPAALTTLWRSAGVSVIEDGKGELIHNDRLIILNPDGNVEDIIDAAAWSPKEVAAQMRHVAGQRSNPIARADLALTKAIAQFCGGSYRIASGLIDVVMALLVMGVGAAFFIWMGRRLFAQGA